MNIDKSFETYFSAKRNNINENGVDKVDWQRIRIQAAISAMQGIISNEGLLDDIDKLSKDVKSARTRTAKISVEYADALVKELKGE